MPRPRPLHRPQLGVLGAVVALTLLVASPAHGAWRRLQADPVRARAPVVAGPAITAPGLPRTDVTPPPAVAPVGGAVVRPFDPPASPYGRGHRGVDLVAAPGEVVRASLPGTVTFAGAVAGRAWVTVAHAGGLRTTYGGLRPTVVAGERVTLGHPLGRATARGTVDWGARRDRAYVDPMALLGIVRVRLVPVDADGGAQ